MGCIRTLLAISVVLAHAWPGEPLVGGRLAVQVFYMISGFLMSYVLTESRSYKTAGSFYASRALRLYPIYFVVAALALAGVLITHKAPFFDTYRAAPVSAVALLGFSNVAIFGQDWVMFLGVRDHILTFMRDFTASDVQLYRGLLTPQTWTLGLELTFYCIAPFVLTHRWAIYTLFALSLAVRAALLRSGLGTHDPWTYRFFPAELSLFLAGSMAHQFLLPLYRKVAGSISTLATAAILAWIFLFPIIPIPQVGKEVILCTGFALLVPMAFIFQNRFGFDTAVGNLSYPIYVGHELVYWTLEHLTRGSIDPRIIGAACVLLAIAFAFALNRFVADPIEAYRRGLKSSAKARTERSHTA